MTFTALELFVGSCPLLVIAEPEAESQCMADIETVKHELVVKGIAAAAPLRVLADPNAL